MALPGEALSFPLCHIFFHFNVHDGKLSCQLYQRSADMFLGVPFNIASYAMLTQIMAHLAGLKPGEFIHTFGDAHIYSNHIEQVKEQMSRKPRPFPELVIKPELKDLDSIKAEYITLEGYDPHPAIKGELTVAGGFQEKDRKDFAAKSG
jgi:thymidylate synthase